MIVEFLIHCGTILHILPLRVLLFVCNSMVLKGLMIDVQDELSALISTVSTILYVVYFRNQYSGMVFFISHLYLSYVVLMVVARKCSA